MTNLLDIRKEYLQAIEMVDEDWCITDEWIALIEKSELSLKEKSVSIAKLVSLFDNNLEAIKKEKDRLTRLEKSYKSNQDKIKEWLAFNLKEAWIEKLDTELYKISFRKSESIEVDETILEDKYKKEKITKTADKTLIKSELKVWKEIKWAKLIINNNLQIK